MIDMLTQHLEDLKAGKVKTRDGVTVGPGLPASFNPAWSHNGYDGSNDIEPEGGAQGDLNLLLITGVPEGYVKKEGIVKLVPGETEGAKHCLNTFNGVETWFPPQWKDEEEYELQDGPVIVIKEEGVKVLHPTHGPVTFVKGTTVECRYPREWDAEQRRERRNADQLLDPFR